MNPTSVRQRMMRSEFFDVTSVAGVASLNLSPRTFGSNFLVAFRYD